MTYTNEPLSDDAQPDAMKIAEQFMKDYNEDLAAIPDITDEQILDIAWEENRWAYMNCDCKEEADIIDRNHINFARRVLALLTPKFDK